MCVLFLLIIYYTTVFARIIHPSSLGSCVAVGRVLNYYCSPLLLSSAEEIDPRPRAAGVSDTTGWCCFAVVCACVFSSRRGVPVVYPSNYSCAAYGKINIKKNGILSLIVSRLFYIFVPGNNIIFPPPVGGGEAQGMLSDGVYSGRRHPNRIV